MIGLDERLFLLINDLAGRSEALDWFMKLVVGEHFIPVLMVIVIIAMWFLGREVETRERSQRAVFCALTGVGFANAVVQIMNFFVDRPRPFEAYPGDVTLLFYQSTDPSFPSNVAAVGFAFAMGAWFGNRKAGYFLCLLAILWSFARVYCGVHYPLDIIGGAAIGILATLAAHLFLRIIEPIPTWVLKGFRKFYLA